MLCSHYWIIVLILCWISPVDTGQQSPDVERAVKSFYGVTLWCGYGQIVYCFP